MTPARKRMRLEDVGSNSVEPLEPSATMNDLPSEVMKNIFSFVGKGNYCFVAPVSKDFCFNYLTMDVIEDKFAHKMDCQLAIGRNKFTTAAAASFSFELAEYCFFKAPEKFQEQLVRKAVRKGKVDIVEIGLAMGVDLKKTLLYVEGGVLQDVVKHGSLEMLKFLIGKDVDVKSETFNILETAATYDQLAILKWLYRNKFIPFSNGHYGDFVLMTAARFGKFAIVEWGG
ncbi:predicted protein [Chaetoceros tenuissimus]|uniref:F-box domain-containing protein n=1 Tax=Chaetoceros tenuissimus TaxID=426638 RepID=A0AAD3CW71_9STRA|nr:predicted protein [Chaetoceros tenuissimus]